MTTSPSKMSEPEYRMKWFEDNDKADEVLVDANTKQPVAAIYYYPPTAHKAEQDRLWETIADYTRVAELEERQQNE